MGCSKLFALRGEARGAARLDCEKAGGTLAVAFTPRGDETYEAWLVTPKGPLLRAPLGASLTAAVPADAKDACGVFVTGAGRIVAGGGSGLSRAEMESATLRVQLALSESARPAQRAREIETAQEIEKTQAVETAREAEKEAAAQTEPAAQAAAPPEREQTAAHSARVTIPASRVAETIFAEMPDAWRRQVREQRAAQIVREASPGPPLKSRAAMSIASSANRLFFPQTRVTRKPPMRSRGQPRKSPLRTTRVRACGGAWQTRKNPCSRCGRAARMSLRIDSSRATRGDVPAGRDERTQHVVSKHKDMHKYAEIALKNQANSICFR